MLGAGALGRPRGMVWGGRREEGSGWGTHVYLSRIHFDIWQNQYNIVKLKKKKKSKISESLTYTIASKRSENADGHPQKNKVSNNFVLGFIPNYEDLFNYLGL